MRKTAAWEWTDDTSMALCLAESLVECGGFDPRDQMKRYLRWWRDGHLSSTGGFVAGSARAGPGKAREMYARSESRTPRSHAQAGEELARLVGDDDVSLVLEQV